MIYDLQALTHAIYPRPSLAAHADWSASPRKRWLALAILQDDGGYLAYAPQPAGEAHTLLHRLQTLSGSHGCALVGFDFPIGLPLEYARRAGIQDFLAVLPELGHGLWAQFYQPAQRPDEVSLYRPFYPARAGHARQKHLLEGLGMQSLDDLRRRCERAHAGRRPACPLFWTLGGQQVGKAAISGWTQVLTAQGELLPGVSLWPFCGRLEDLLRPGQVVVAETYPAEYYAWLGVRFSPRRPGSKVGKRQQAERAANAVALLAWAEAAGISLQESLRQAIREGFGASLEGEDAFDAVVGLFGLLEVVLGRRPAAEPQDETIRRVEGWILGQSWI